MIKLKRIINAINKIDELLDDAIYPNFKTNSYEIDHKIDDTTNMLKEYNFELNKMEKNFIKQILRYKGGTLYSQKMILLEALTYKAKYMKICQKYNKLKNESSKIVLTIF